VFLQRGLFPSARAKNSENHKEYDDVKYVIKELMKRRVDTLKGALWGWSTRNLKGRAMVVVLEQGDVLLCQSKK
jgi:hypothetical protein